MQPGGSRRWTCLQSAYKSNAAGRILSKMETTEALDTTMITTQIDSPFEIILPAETLDPPLPVAARLIRGALLLGFVAVMLMEAWLLWQVWRLIG
jgi:hypothetical protein